MEKEICWKLEFFSQYHCHKNGRDIHAINFAKPLILAQTFCRVIYSTFTAVKIRNFA